MGRTTCASKAASKRGGLSTNALFCNEQFGNERGYADWWQGNHSLARQESSLSESLELSVRIKVRRRTAVITKNPGNS
jgi:hypothetical protein